MIGSFNKNKVTKILNLPDHLQILWLIALGKPIEKCVLEEAKNGNIKYYRDENEIHYVPKRPLDEIIINRVANIYNHWIRHRATIGLRTLSGSRGDGMFSFRC